LESRAFLGWGGQTLETIVLASRRLTPHTHGIMLKKPAGFSFKPTQFTFLSLETGAVTDVRPMSIATSPRAPTSNTPCAYPTRHSSGRSRRFGRVTA